jgi:chemotaxis regulatin CheY-phosphate phosphatase CheZ
MNCMQKSVMKVAELGRLSRTWKNNIQLILLDKWKRRETDSISLVRDRIYYRAVIRATIPKLTFQI